MAWPLKFLPPVFINILHPLNYLTSRVCWSLCVHQSRMFFYGIFTGQQENRARREGDEMSQRLPAGAPAYPVWLIRLCHLIRLLLPLQMLFATSKALFITKNSDLRVSALRHLVSHAHASAKPNQTKIPLQWSRFVRYEHNLLHAQKKKYFLSVFCLKCYYI